MRRAAKVDSNQSLITEHLRRMGYSVQLLHTIGKGCPDMIVGIKGRNYLIELKDGEKTASGKKLTVDEKKWHQVWRGQVAICESLDEILKVIS